MPLERDINIAVNGCSEFATSIQKGPFMAMLISRSRGTYVISKVMSSCLGGSLSKNSNVFPHMYTRRVRKKCVFTPPWGPFTYDVRTEGGGGLAQKQIIVLISCVSEAVTRERGS